MIETLTIITVSLILLIIFRPGKTPPLNNPLTIERAGKYHITLAPQLNLAQPFIEAVAGQLGDVPTDRYSETLFFEVDDTHAKAHGHTTYLLAITQRNGMIYFQATSPKQQEAEQLHTINEFSQNVLARFAASGTHDATLTGTIRHAIDRATVSRKIQIKPLAA